jgi:S-adenosylhomocysteine hydrolase
MEGRLKFQVVAVNNGQCKYLFDNRYGTGQSTWDGIIRTTNMNIAGNMLKKFNLKKMVNRYEKLYKKF